MGQRSVISKGEGTQSFHYTCPSPCTTKWTQKLNVFGIFQHMHKHGVQTVTTHHRNGKQLPDLARDDFYNFDFQTTLPVDTVILPGDELRTTCTYRRQSDKDIRFADASEDEMCVVFVYVWPTPVVSAMYCGHQTNEQCGNPAAVPNAASALEVAFGRSSPSVCGKSTSPSALVTESDQEASFASGRAAASVLHIAALGMATMLW